MVMICLQFEVQRSIELLNESNKALHDGYKHSFTDSFH